MEVVEQSKSLLATQSLFASLHIHRGAPIVQPIQQQYDQLLRYYDDSSRINNTPTENYSITSLPPTMLRIPINTIYDRIMFIPTDMPDFRFVQVSKRDSTPIVSSLRSGVLKDDIVSANCSVPVDSCSLLGEFNTSKKKTSVISETLSLSQVAPTLIRDILTLLRADPKNSPESLVTSKQSFAGAIQQAESTSDYDHTNPDRLRLIRQLADSKEFDEADFIGISPDTVFAIRQRIDNFL